SSAVYAPSFSRDTIVDTNIFYSTSTQNPPITISGKFYATDNLQVDPLFVDYPQNQFRIMSSSSGRNSASDYTDIGANVEEVGPKTKTTTPTAPSPSSPTGLKVSWSKPSTLLASSSLK